MKRRSWLLTMSVLAVIVLLSVSPVLAQSPAGQIDQTDPKYKAYVDTLAYWFKSQDEKDWQARLAAALVPAPDQIQEKDDDDLADKVPAWALAMPEAERVVLTGLPSNSWWIDCWRQELDGQWVKVPSWRPADQLPSPVAGDLMTNGKLPAAYVIRVCEKGGGVLLGEPKLIVVSWTKGNGGTWPQEFNVPSLPKALPEQLSGITM